MVQFRKTNITLALLLWAAIAPALELNSPNGHLRVSLDVRDSDGLAACPVYRVDYRGKQVIVRSRLGFDVDHEPFATGLKIVQVSTRSADSTWKPIYGERSTIRDRFNEMSVQFEGKQTPSHRLEITWRAYDEGVAVCYGVPSQAAFTNLTITRETTEFRFPDDHPAWATYTAQGVYTNVPLSRIQPGCERPLVIRAANDRYVALAEAQLVDFARMKLAPLSGKPHSLVSDLSGPVDSPLPLRTPWRVIMLAKSPGRLLEQNDLLLNLNEPCALTNTSWIKPGKVLRDKTLTTVGGKSCVDFAVQHNLQYLLLDAGWYGPETSGTSDARRVEVDPARYEGPLDVPEVLRYSNERGVGVILYVNRRALERQLDELLPLYSSWGVKGVKFGFVNVGSQEWTRWLHQAIRKAADHHLMVDVHDEYRPTGWSRTYPNLMTVEGVRGDEERQANRQALTTLFTRFLAGPADNTICYYDERVDRFASHGFQLAKAVCYYSPLQCLYWYDRPLPKESSRSGVATNTMGNNVIGDEPELEFFARCPTVWDETHVVHGEIGESAILARRSGAEWFIGCLNANQPRSFEVPLNFLQQAQTYTARIYSDDPDTMTRTRVKTESVEVNNRTVLKLAASAQGGVAVWIAPTQH